MAVEEGDDDDDVDDDDEVVEEEGEGQRGTTKERRTMLYYFGILRRRRYQAAMFHLHGTLCNPLRFRILKSGSILRFRSRVVSRARARAHTPRAYTARVTGYHDTKFVR